MTDPGCGRYLQVLLAGVDDQVDAVRAAPYCGEDQCQPIFGADVARFVVTYVGGKEEEFSCWVAPLDPPRCEPADP